MHVGVFKIQSVLVKFFATILPQASNSDAITSLLDILNDFILLPRYQNQLEKFCLGPKKSAY